MKKQRVLLAERSKLSRQFAQWVALHLRPDERDAMNAYVVAEEQLGPEGPHRTPTVIAALEKANADPEAAAHRAHVMRRAAATSVGTSPVWRRGPVPVSGC